MQLLKTLIICSLLFFSCANSFAKNNDGGCCNEMGGVNYCDSSAGRLVCKNGFYSACYCTPHAVMDLQLLKGCCLWHGGVIASYENSGLIICNDGWVSEECSLEHPQQRIATW